MISFLSSFTVLFDGLFVGFPPQVQNMILPCPFGAAYVLSYHWAVSLVLMLFVVFHFWVGRSVGKQKGLLTLSSLLSILTVFLLFVALEGGQGCFAYGVSNISFVVKEPMVLTALFLTFLLTWWAVFFLAGVRLFKFYGRRAALRAQVIVGFVQIFLLCSGVFYSLLVYDYLKNFVFNPWKVLF